MKLYHVTKEHRGLILKDVLGLDNYDKIEHLLRYWADSSEEFRNNIIYPLCGVTNAFEWRRMNIEFNASSGLQFTKLKKSEFQ